MRFFLSLILVGWGWWLQAQNQPIKDTKTKDIETVVVLDRSDPKALKILDEVNARFQDNSPRQLPSYAFKSYEKISIDFDEDSLKTYQDFIKHRADSLALLPKKDSETKKKLIKFDKESIYKIAAQSKLFIWERAQEFLYSQKYGDKIKVLDQKMSGIKQVPYEILALMEYDKNEEPEEVAQKNRALYRFFLADSLMIEGRKTYVIRFRFAGTKQTLKSKKYNGYIYIDQATYGIKEIAGNRQTKGQEYIKKTWRLQSGKWFIEQEKGKFKIGSFSFKDEDCKKQKFGNYLWVNYYYFDYQVPMDNEEASVFKGYTMSVENADGSKIAEFRKENLSERDVLAYEKVDSIGQKYKVDQKLGFLSTLLSGKIRWGKVDFLAGEILKYNSYEGTRIGVAAKLNEKFNPYISPDVYVAYGFKDKAFKYGVGVDVKTTLQKNSFFRVEYYNDVQSAGRFNENFWNFRMQLMNGGVDLNNDRFWRFKGGSLSYETDFGSAITARLRWRYQNEKALFGYQYKDQGDTFDAGSVMFSLKYAPFEKSLMTPSGKFTYDTGHSALYFNYEQGLNPFHYSRIDALYSRYFKTQLGGTGARVYGGFVLGDVPIWHNFEIAGLNAAKGGTNFNLTSYLGFATMDARKYYADRFVGTYITHRIPWNFKSFGRNISNFDVVYKAAIGGMKHPEYHQFNFEPLNHLYQETGIEWNNFLSTSFNLGFFYRVGYYHSPQFKDNFAIQLKLKLLGF
ncbi:hypothetical protein [Riemerella columbina]|uniref:hypothetical protein n=1 Tax=Riemerella columbina TaxID=103810 RepID=UPI00266E904C|nr:hypothetical protein [Riemerella columbina]WKS94770.1 hypothetical protein NYR17_07505 [Riemerella columbina]